MCVCVCVQGGSRDERRDGTREEEWKLMVWEKRMEVLKSNRGRNVAPSVVITQNISTVIFRILQYLLI